MRQGNPGPTEKQLASSFDAEKPAVGNEHLGTIAQLFNEKKGVDLKLLLQETLPRQQAPSPHK